MIGRYEAYIDGVALTSINNNIIITDISHKPASIQQKTARVANRDGSRVVGSYADAASVGVKFLIREYDILKRQEICQKIAQWATQGTYITTNDRRWQKLRCVCEQTPTIESSKNWTDEITMTFKGYNPPYWQEINATKVTLGGTNGATSGNTSVHVLGNVKNTLIGAKITAKASISTVYLAVNSKVIGLAGLSLSSGDVVTIDYDDDMNIRIKKGSTSLLGKRTAESADDLLVDCGKMNTFSFESSAAAVVEFTIRGWWM